MTVKSTMLNCYNKLVGIIGTAKFYILHITYFFTKFKKNV